MEYFLCDMIIILDHFDVLLMSNIVILEWLINRLPHSCIPAEEEEDGDEGEVDVGAAAPPVHRSIAAGRPERRIKTWIMSRNFQEGVCASVRHNREMRIEFPSPPYDCKCTAEWAASRAPKLLL